MTEITDPERRRLSLFPYLYKHNSRGPMNLSQFAARLGIPVEPMRQIVETGLGPWLLPAETKGDHGGNDYWFSREMLDLWRNWFLRSASIEDLKAARRIVIDWDQSQRERDFRSLDDHEPNEYFRYFLDREYII